MALIVVMRGSFAGGAGEASQPEPERNAAHNEQARIVPRQPVYILEQLIDALAAQIVGEFDHALRHAGNVRGQAQTIMSFQLLSGCLSALSDSLELVGSRFAIAFKLAFAFSFHLIGSLPSLGFSVFSCMLNRRSSGGLTRSRS